MVSPASPSNPRESVSKENHDIPSPNADLSHHTCTEIFRKNVAITSPESKIESCDKEMSRISEETAAQKAKRKALEDKEDYIQMIMEEDEVSREVAETKYDSLIGSI